MKRFLPALLFLLCAVIIGCGGSQLMQFADAGNIPDWFTNIPQDPNCLSAPNSQTSEDMQLAVDKATEAGRADIGRQVQMKIEGIQKRFAEETGTGNDA